MPRVKNPASARSSEGPAPLPSPAHEFFGAPPLIPGEDQRDYEALFGRVVSAVRPTDFIEEIWVRDVVDLVWEAIRLRRLKAKYLEVAAPKAVETILNSVLGNGYSESREIAHNWALCQPAALDYVTAQLDAADLTVDSVMAQTLVLKLDEVERIDRMIALTEGRRNGVLREIDRHRAVLAERLRRAAQDVEDAEFQTVPTDVIEAPKAEAAE